MKHSGYLNRALRSGDRRYAQIFSRLGYDTTALTTEAGEPLAPIPANWRDLSWPELKSLAATVSEMTIKTKDDAIAGIELEIERRKGA